MRRISAPAYSASLFLSIFLLACTPLHAQTAPSAGTTVAVKMLDTVDSSSDPAGKQYRASVTKAVTASNGVAIAQGTAATVTLTNTGSRYSAQLSSITVNGQPVTVTSGSASVTAAQSAASSTVNSVGSVLGGFGHHVNAPATAVLTGQRVVLPTGVTLSFVLSQPPGSSQAAPTAPPASAGQPTIAPLAPASNPPSGSPAVAAPGQHWWLCQYVDPKDLNKPVLGRRVYFSVFPSSAAPQDAGGNASAMAKHFIAYVQQNHKVVTALTITPSGAYNGTAGGYCKRVSDDAGTRANSMDMMQKQWASSTPSVEAIQVSFVDTPAQAATVTANFAASPAAAAPRPTTAATGGPFISCSTSRDGGIDTYLTGVFQTTRPVRQLPGGGNLVDQSILDDFYAYLKQKGYNFKPGSNYACDVTPTEAGTKAAQHKRAYEGGACSTCGKIVETGWKDTP